MKFRYYTSLISFAVGIGFWFSCSRGWLLPPSGRLGDIAWCWGANPQRTGYQDEALSPPLELAWMGRLSSAPGEAISASGDFLFIGTQDGRIFCLRAQDGKTIKNIKIADRMEVTCAVQDSMLIAASRWGKKSLWGHRLPSGRRIWSAEAGPIESEPLILGQSMVVGNDRAEAKVLDVLTGRLIWQTRLDSPVRGTAAVSKDSVVFATEKGMLFCLSVHNGKVLWKTTLPGTIEASPVVAWGKVMLGTRNGWFQAVFSADGKESWRFKAEGGIYLTAAADVHSVYFGSSRGMLYCLDGGTGYEKWSMKTKSVMGSAPLIAGTWIYFGTMDKMLHAVDAKTGQESWRFLLKGRIETTPMIWNGMLFTGSEDNVIYGFRPVKAAQPKSIQSRLRRDRSPLAGDKSDSPPRSAPVVKDLVDVVIH